jgi:SAM-dependent methyltransferase
MWDDPLLYELEYADDPEFDVPYWQGLIAELGARRVLELACGTGRLTFPLARTGAHVTGLDSSAPFLARAAERVPAELRSRVELVEGDMRAPGLAGPFDLVLVAFNSLAYLHTIDDQLACLRAARGLLADGGRFAFDLVMPRFDLLAEAMGRCCPPVRVDADHPVAEQGLRRMIRSYVDRYDAASQTLRSTNTYTLVGEDGRVEHRIGDVDWHIYFPRELEAVLAAAGLRVEHRWGGYDRSPWSAASRRYVWVCTAA